MTSITETRIRQNSKIADVTYVVPLTQAEARGLADSIKGHLEEADAQIIELHEREGWSALGYTSWNECVRAEFNIGKRRGYQMLAAARVRKNLSELPSECNNVAQLPNNRQAEELSKLKTPQEQREAYDGALRRSNGKPTTAVVEQVVKKKRVEAVYRQGEVVLHVPTGLRCTVASVLPDGTYRLKPMVSSPSTSSVDWSKPVLLDDIAVGKAGVAKQSAGASQSRPVTRTVLLQRITAHLNGAPEAMLQSVLQLLESSMERAG